MRDFIRGILLTTSVLSCASMAQAQGVATSLRDLQLLVRPGETVTVVDAGGNNVQGRVESFTASSLVLGTADRRRSWEEAEVVAVRQRRPDSLANGALIGLGVGAGSALVVFAVFAREEGDIVGIDGGDAVAMTAIFAGAGVAIGVGIDAMITREYDVFRRGGTGPQVRVQPLLAPHGGGVRVALAF
ncbi:hypothetical protein [Luteitalea sp.]|uniref:hypothetical protein n=1 Tax=Luteitalea sp. TaxID=2004800 RepID=UPI0025C1A6E4|nr:hypothetical protein [Luteitalea sp.]